MRMTRNRLPLPSSNSSGSRKPSPSWRSGASPPASAHCCNSAGVINYPEMHLDMVRPGVILYGLSPSADCQGRMPLSPAMSLYSTLTLVKTVAAGTTLSYGRIFTAPHKMRVGTVSIGYADGFERNLSGKAKVLIRGKFAPVIRAGSAWTN